MAKLQVSYRDSPQPKPSRFPIHLDAATQIWTLHRHPHYQSERHGVTPKAGLPRSYAWFIVARILPLEKPRLRLTFASQPARP